MNLKLYLVTDSRNMDKELFYQKIEQAIIGGVTVVQLREKNRESLEMYQMGLKVKEICDRYKVPLLVDDRIDVAMAINADGVHLGQSDIPLEIARKLLPDKIIGITAKTVEQAKLAQRQGADYVGVGAIYPTPTKETDVTSIETLRAICENVSIPVVAIGGLKAHNLDVLAGTGIKGVCVVSAIMGADNPTKSAQELYDATMEVIGDSNNKETKALFLNDDSEVGDREFYENKNITNITLPQGVMRIGQNAFMWCSNLKSIILPDTLTSINDCAFYHCDSLEEIELPNKLTAIGDGAFCFCKGLKEIKLPNGLKYIGNDAFSCCYNLTDIYVPETVDYIGSEVFDYDTTVHVVKDSYAHNYCIENKLDFVITE